MKDQSMSNDTFISITGRNQGLISKSCSTKASTGNKCIPNHLDEIKVLSVAHEMFISIDPTQSKHQPVVFTKHLDRSSPLLLTAFFTGEIFDCEISYYQQSPADTEERYFSITLVGAIITAHSTKSRRTTDNGPETQERLAIQYSQITCTHHQKNITGSATYINTEVDII
jgi:type VI secretion system Hcp family effector